MRLKTNIEDGVILLFNVVVFGYSKPVLEGVLSKMWLDKRWKGRFYFSVKDRCHKYVVDLATFNRKECLYKHDFIKMLKLQIPKGKKITID
jgi:hypothetical protein